MSDLREEDDEHWPVTYPVETPPRLKKRARERKASRWPGAGKVDTSEVQKRFLWLLFAVEICMALAAVCVLPLAFLNLPLYEKGVIGAISTRLGEWLGLSSQVTCLVLALPIPIFLFTMSSFLWWWRRIQHKAEETED